MSLDCLTASAVRISLLRTPCNTAGMIGKIRRSNLATPAWVPGNIDGGTDEEIPANDESRHRPCWHGHDRTEGADGRCTVPREGRRRSGATRSVPRASADHQGLRTIEQRANGIGGPRTKGTWSALNQQPARRSRARDPGAVLPLRARALSRRQTEIRLHRMRRVSA